MQKMQVRLGSLVRDNNQFYFYGESKNIVELVGRGEAPSCEKGI
jgi:hypothetical protein